MTSKANPQLKGEPAKTELAEAELPGAEFAAPAFRFRYESTAEEGVEAMYANVRRSILARRIWYVLTSGALLFILWIVPNFQEDLIRLLLGLMAVTLLAYALMLRSEWRRKMLAYFKSRPQDGEADVLLDEAGYHARSANAETHLGWGLFSACQEIKRPIGLLALYIGSSPAFYVPRRATASDQEWSALCRFVHECIVAARPPKGHAFEPVVPTQDPQPSA